MSSTYEQAYINRFSDDLRHLVEQTASKLRPAVKIEMAKGENHFFNRLGTFTASQRTARNEAVDLQDAPHSRRMATIKTYDAATTIDTIDEVKTAIDPTSAYAMKLARAHAKNLDDVIIEAALGSASTGKDGSGSQAFDTSNQQIAHGSAGFTVAKFNQAMRILEGNEVDIDGGVDLVLLLGARGVEDLLGESNFVSFDFQETKTLAGRKLPAFRGVNIIRTQRVTDKTSGTTFRGLMMTTDTIRVAMAKDLKVDISDRKDLKGHPKQIYTETSFGAVRMEEETIVDVLYQ